MGCAASRVAGGATTASSHGTPRDSAAAPAGSSQLGRHRRSAGTGLGSASGGSTWSTRSATASGGAGRTDLGVTSRRGRARRPSRPRLGLSGGVARAIVGRSSAGRSSAQSSID